MVRTLLVRGMLSGLAAAVLAWVFAYLVGEPALDGGIAYEDMVSAASGEAGEEPLVSRGIQSTLGLGVGVLIYGIAIGGIFALVYAAVYGRIGRLSPRATSAVLALVGFVVVILVPFLKYPSNPPASSDDDTIGTRTGTYVLMVLLSVAVAVAAVWVGRRLVARFGTWNGVLLAVVGYAVVIGIVGALLPTIAETPQDFPAVVLYDFRLSTLGIHVVLWAVIGLLFGALVDGSARRAGRASVEAGQL
ncbi:CbtA family protein [Pseudonocardia endophytica]|uniref:Putative cobalt transporter subunit CbtA n=1 Tax=Pseudonocardia endophytica TaxID=401976 RepID=A0A4R1HW32_PSEEN|nr:CbtA family protein [Pseudonocardia endophytica]TCK21732.1 putative cobalt transporter subunit CbtA [Pseudonocardia endophytica]